MSSRPQNIGIKAIEIYFPSQVRLSPLLPLADIALGVASTLPHTT
jgi:hypothetical protein